MSIGYSGRKDLWKYSDFYWWTERHSTKYYAFGHIVFSIWLYNYNYLSGQMRKSVFLMSVCGTRGTEVNQKMKVLNWENICLNVGWKMLSCKSLIASQRGKMRHCVEGYWQIKLATFQANGGNINVRNELRNYLGQQPILFWEWHYFQVIC